MIDYESFIQWAKTHFDDVIVHQDEIKLNSIFCEDTKHHLWVNPKKNAYHCWKSDQSGNVIQLVSQVSKCSFQEAAALLQQDDLRLLEERVAQFFKEKNAPPPPAQLSLPPFTYLLSKMSPASSFYQRAKNYLENRKLPLGRMLVCIQGKYRNRIIIPYYGPAGDLIYWNGRDFTDSQKERYRGPDFADCGIGKGDVLFMEEWPKPGSKIYLTEGEFDALSLTQCGFRGAACGGKNLLEPQIELLRPYRICISFDADKSGAEALNIVGDKLISSGITEVNYVRPPLQVKDWNQMLIDFGEEVIKLYLQEQEKPFTPWTSNELRFNNR